MNDILVQLTTRVDEELKTQNLTASNAQKEVKKTVHIGTEMTEQVTKELGNKPENASKKEKKQCESEFDANTDLEYVSV